MVETPIYFSGLLWFCCYFTEATVRVCSTAELKPFNPSPSLREAQLLKRPSVCVGTGLTRPAPCVLGSGPVGSQALPRAATGNVFGENGLVWEWAAPAEKFCLRKWSEAYESQRTTSVAHSGVKQINAKADVSLAATDLHTGKL